MNGGREGKEAPVKAEPAVGAWAVMDGALGPLPVRAKPLTLEMQTLWKGNQ